MNQNGGRAADVWLGERMKAASVAVNLTDDEKKFENCAELSVDQAKTTMTLASRMCRTMLKFFICQLNGMWLELQRNLHVVYSICFYS